MALVCSEFHDTAGFILSPFVNSSRPVRMIAAEILSRAGADWGSIVALAKRLAKTLWANSPIAARASP